MTRSKVAAKYVNLVDRVREPAPNMSIPVPVVRRVRLIAPVNEMHAAVRELKAQNAWYEFDDRTLASLVGTGLLGQ